MKKKKIGKWIGAIFLALLLYIMIGAVAPYMKAPEVTEETRKKAENAEYLGKGPSGERARILVENKTALAERIRLISQAKERVVLSTFDFRADESGKDMLAALQAAADRGVSVRVIVDGMSGFLRIIGNEYFGTLSAMDNVEIKIYNPFNFAKPWHLMARLHDKYLIVDHSAIIGNEYFGTLSAMDNVEIKIYNPFNFAKPWHLMARLHDKYLIVDHSAYILGGRNTFSYFLGDYDSYKNYDWDVLIYEQEYQEGCSMEQVEQYFESVWKLPESRLYFLGDYDSYKNYDWDVLIYEQEYQEGCSMEQVEQYFESVWKLPESRLHRVKHPEKQKYADAGKELRERYEKMQEEHPDWFETVDYVEKTVPVNKDRVKHPEKQKYADAGKELRERYEKMQEEHPDWFETVDYVEKTVPVNKATLLSNPATLYAKEPVVFYSVTELMARAQENWFETVDYVEKTVPVNKATLLSNPATLYAKEPVVFYSVTELMARAQEKVRFHTPYILCNKWMLERLENVCAAVPDVTMMTNSIANNGNPFGSMDYWKNKKKILDTGVHILEYDGGISYHGKCFTADDRIVGIGSFNWDMRSVYIDTELMLVLDSPELNTHLQWIMDEYEKEALTIQADGTAFNWDMRSVYIDTELMLVLDSPELNTHLQWIMDEYEKEALTIQADGTAEAPEGMEAQEVSLKNKIQIAVLYMFGYWARFLM